MLANSSPISRAQSHSHSHPESSPTAALQGERHNLPFQDTGRDIQRDMALAHAMGHTTIDLGLKPQNFHVNAHRGVLRSLVSNLETKLHVGDSWRQKGQGGIAAHGRRLTRAGPSHGVNTAIALGCVLRGISRKVVTWRAVTELG